VNLTVLCRPTTLNYLMLCRPAIVIWIDIVQAGGCEFFNVVQVRIPEAVLHLRRWPVEVCLVHGLEFQVPLESRRGGYHVGIS